MSFDDFGVNNDVKPDEPSAGENRIDGDEDYITEVWESNEGIDNPALDDDDEVEASTIPQEQDVKEIAKGNKEIEEPPEAELSS